MITTEAIGNRVREKLKEKHMTGQRLAQKALVSDSAVYRCLHGQAVPNGITLACIARALDTTVEYLVFGEEEKTWE